MNELLNIKEDVWDPKKMCMIGSVVRYTDFQRPFDRHDVDGNVVERYKNVSIREMGRPDIAGQHATSHINDTGLVSLSPDGVTTDYYVFPKGDPTKHVETYDLEKPLAEKSNGVIIRHSNDGQRMGLYYCGAYNLLVERFGETSDFLTLLRNHYVNIPHPLENAGVIIKAFGNEAVYVMYARYITSPDEVWA
jgi:hypothetical protein